MGTMEYYFKGSALAHPTSPNLSPPASSPTSTNQINLASMRNNSLTNQETSFDPRVRNSCLSLDEKTRSMSRSGSFRDEEGETAHLGVCVCVCVELCFLSHLGCPALDRKSVV